MFPNSMDPMQDQGLSIPITLSLRMYCSSSSQGEKIVVDEQINTFLSKFKITVDFDRTSYVVSILRMSKKL